MKSLFEDLSPLAPFRFFEEVSAIPRASGNEAGIAAYLMRFAGSRGLACCEDAIHNVFIQKPASPGREGEPALLLQCHTDMVAEKHGHVAHDFEKEGIRLLREGNVLRADGTTLGADDGFGVALILAVLDDAELSHPALECLFTVSEEIGLEGAGAFDYSRVSARRMINLDSAEEDTVIIGCCGGLRTDLTVPLHFTDVSEAGLRLRISGLCGGHSGEDIDRGRLNAHVLMGAVLRELQTVTPFLIASLTGGDKDNAIPRECEAVILPTDLAAARAQLAATAATIADRVVAKEDNGLTLSVESVPVGRVTDAKDTAALLRLLSVRNGVLYSRTEPPLMPETSRNLARLRTEADHLAVAFSSRSEREARIAESRAELDALAAELGGTTHHHAGYPGWVSPAEAPLVKRWQEAYLETTGKHTAAAMIHAGLECGLISAALPGLTAISVGCNIRDLHTPAETMELDSMARIYRTLCCFLKKTV